MEIESDPNQKPPGIQLTVVHDVPLVSNYFLILLIMLVPLAGIIFFNRSFEAKRWEDSDFNPYYTNESFGSDNE